MKFLRTSAVFVTKYLAFIIIIAAVSAWLWPKSFSVIRADFIPFLLGLVMFGMGVSLRMSDFKELFLRPKAVILGVLAQFSVMPLLAFGLVHIFSLPLELALGVILIGASPSGTASNVITYLAKGDVSLSVSITTLTTLLAPIITPFLIFLLTSQSIQVDMLAMFISILEVILLPIALGALLHRFFPRFSHDFASILPLLSAIAITAIIVSIVAAHASKLFDFGALILCVVILHNLLGYAFGYLIARLFALPLSQASAFCIEVGMQNSGLATTLAVSHFALYPLAAIPAVIFSIWHNISGSLLANYFSHKVQKTQNSQKT
ncbi:sodium transporter [Helicobacter sp. 12S02634-8]|nr:sodium transporter [Helicobacter sp. 12S02634-8]